MIHQLRDLVMSQEYVTWMHQKFSWSEGTFRDIAWSAFYKAMDKFQGHQNSIRKYIHGWLPVAEVVKCYNEHEITKCPCCNGRERQDHVLQCPSQKLTQKQEERFDELWQKLEKTTDPILLEAMKKHIKRWIQNPQYMAMARGSALQSVVLAQNRIGWTNFLHRHIFSQFIKNQQDLYTQQGKNTPDLLAFEWGVHFIKSIWGIADEIWTLRCQQLHVPEELADPVEHCKTFARL